MFKLTEDIENELQMLYPDIDMELFLHQLISKIVDKTLQSGACSIREFGKFIAFQTFSTRTARNIIRFKFKFSPSFLNKIKFDELLMKNLPMKMKAEFNESHEAKCSGVQHRKLNYQKVTELNANEAAVTKSNLGKLEIMKILQED